MSNLPTGTLKPNEYYKIREIKPIRTRFGNTYLIYDRVHSEWYYAPTKIKKYLDTVSREQFENGDGTWCKFKTHDYKSFNKKGQTIKFLDLEITKCLTSL